MQIVRGRALEIGERKGKGEGTRFRVGLCKFYDINKNVDNINFTSGSWVCLLLFCVVVSIPATSLGH